MELVSVTGDDLRGYKVEGFVDSQNSYGAMIRNDFSAEVKVTSAGFLTVTSSSVATKANIARTTNYISNYIWISILVAIGGAILYLLNGSFVDLFF